jgi:hypothetical protein
MAWARMSAQSFARARARRVLHADCAAGPAICSRASECGPPCQQGSTCPPGDITTISPSFATLYSFNANVSISREIGAGFVATASLTMARAKARNGIPRSGVSPPAIRSSGSRRSGASLRKQSLSIQVWLHARPWKPTASRNYRTECRFSTRRAATVPVSHLRWRAPRTAGIRDHASRHLLRGCADSKIWAPRTGIPKRFLESSNVQDYFEGLINDAQDAILFMLGQRALLQVWRWLATFRFESTSRTWMRRVAINQVLQFLPPGSSRGKPWRPM